MQGLGQALAQQGHLAEAETIYRQLIQLDQRCAPAGFHHPDDLPVSLRREEIRAEYELRVLRIGAVVEVTGIRPTSRHGRAIVDSHMEVYNQRGEHVMHYEAKRMLAGRPQ